MKRTVDNFLKRCCEEKVVKKDKSLLEEFCDEINKDILAQKDFKNRIKKAS